MPSKNYIENLTQMEAKLAQLGTQWTQLRSMRVLDIMANHCQIFINVKIFRSHTGHVR